MATGTHPNGPHKIPLRAIGIGNNVGPHVFGRLRARGQIFSVQAEGEATTLAEEAKLEWISSCGGFEAPVL